MRSLGQNLSDQELKNIISEVDVDGKTLVMKGAIGGLLKHINNTSILVETVKNKCKNADNS